MSKEPYKYCYSCGKILIVEKYIWAYDGNTREPKTGYLYTCPGNSWWIFLRHPVTEEDAYAYMY